MVTFLYLITDTTLKLNAPFMYAVTIIIDLIIMDKVDEILHKRED
mgnify:CR=1 FL=1